MIDKRNPHVHAKIESNVKVTIVEGKRIVQQKLFKNTATRLLTQGICNYLTGADSSYIRGVGRPNYMSLGTMGITRQGNTDACEFEPQFSELRPEPKDRTRPWFESTSLALTDVCGTKIIDDEGRNPYFWNPEYGWGTPDTPDERRFEGELCSAIEPGTEQEWLEQGWEPLSRLPILRADVVSDNASDRDFGIDGYSSAVIFYSYASPKWVNKLLTPQKHTYDPMTMTDIVTPVGPQLERVAISEFGLYERSNFEPDGLHTMLAGFRVPTEEDVMYLSHNQAMILEWRISVRAIMPNEEVRAFLKPIPQGIALSGKSVDERTLQFRGIVRGDDGVSQDVNWSVSHQTPGSDTSISDDGLLTVAQNDRSDWLYITATSAEDAEVSTTAVLFRGALTDIVTSVIVTSELLQNGTIQNIATVTGSGTYSTDVTWSLEGALSEQTTLSDTGLLTIGSDESAECLKVTATSVEDENLFSSNILMLGPTLIVFDTNPITQVSTLVKPIGRIAVQGMSSAVNVEFTLTFRVQGADLGNLRVIIDQTTGSAETASAHTIPVTSLTDKIVTITDTIQLSGARSRIVITAQGPATLSDVHAFLVGAGFKEVEYFDTTTVDDYLIAANNEPIYYKGSITKPMLLAEVDGTPITHVANVLMDGNLNITEVGIPEGIEYIE